MTATLQDLYNNVKTLFTKYFNSKEYDEVFLPKHMRKQFVYKNGKLYIKPSLTLTVTGSSFASYDSSPFTYTGDVYINYGDGSELETYTGGQLSHTYESSGTYDITVHGGVTALNESCFMRCTGLTSVTLGDSVTSLGDWCFSSCTGLKSIDLGSVTSLGKRCFRDCIGLTSLAIPSSVTSIEDDCFYKTSNLTLLYLYWTGSDTIITYDTSGWLNYASVSNFSIPSGTTNLYTAKDYPSNMLTERSD